MRRDGRGEARQLLAQIPEQLRDVPHPGLENRTPRQVVEAGHIDFSPENPGCLACRDVLRGLAWGERWFDKVGGL